MKKLVIFELVRSISIALVGVYFFATNEVWTEQKCLLALGYIALCVYIIIRSIIDIYRFMKLRNIEKENRLSVQEA